MEKRNFVTSYRTVEYGTLEKEATFDDAVIDEVKSELTEEAIKEDEKSDKEFFKK